MYINNHGKMSARWQQKFDLKGISRNNWYLKKNANDSKLWFLYYTEQALGSNIEELNTLRPQEKQSTALRPIKIAG